MEARANLRLVGEQPSDVVWPETGELLSPHVATERIRDLLDLTDGLKRTIDKQAREIGALSRRVAEDEDPSSHPQGAEIVALIERWKLAAGHGKSKVSADRIKAVKSRLRDGYTIEQIELAVDGICAYPYVGTGGQRFANGKPAQRHDRLGIALGGGEAVERFAVLGHAARKAGWTPEGWPS